MEKRFNVTGICIPEMHYMVDIESRLKEIRKLVDRGEYFTINRARQYGKTTTLACLKKTLSDTYAVSKVWEETHFRMKIFSVNISSVYYTIH